MRVGKSPRNENRGPCEGPRWGREKNPGNEFSGPQVVAQRRLTAAAMAAERAELSAGKASVEIMVPSAAMAEISEVEKSTMTRAPVESSVRLATEEMAPVSKSPEFSSERITSAGA